MDPLVLRADYDIEHLLRKEYSAAKVAEYLQLYDGSLAGKWR